MAARPYGIYIYVEPSSSSETSLLGTNTAITTLFGSISCAGSICSGGVTGIFLSENWNDFQKAAISHPGGVQTETIVLDVSSKLNGALGSIKAVEAYVDTFAPGFAFDLSLGLKSGEKAAYDVLDMYAAASAAGTTLTGTQPNVMTTAPYTQDEIESGPGVRIRQLQRNECDGIRWHFRYSWLSRAMCARHWPNPQRQHNRVRLNPAPSHLRQ